MKKTLPRYISNIIFPMLSLGLMFLFWFILSLSVSSELLVPSINSTFKSLFGLLNKSTFWYAIGTTLWRGIRSFIYATLTAMVLSVFAYKLNIFRKLINPIIAFLRAVPTMSVILLTLIWLDSDKAPMLIAFLITFPMLYSVFLSALDSIDNKLILMSSVYKVRKKDVLLSLYLPSVAPVAFSGMQSAVSLNLKVIIASEVLAQTRKSIGIYMQRDMVYFETGELLAWTLAAVLLSYLLELTIVIIKKLVVRWKS